LFLSAQGTGFNCPYALNNYEFLKSKDKPDPGFRALNVSKTKAK